MISVVIPCFNAATTIGATIESALSQDVDREVIVVDDGSTDASAEIVRAFGTQIVAHFGPNAGASAARNIGWSLGRGDWVQFLDSDDLLYPRSLATSLEVVRSRGADVVVGGWREFNERGGQRIITRERTVDARQVSANPEIAFATNDWAPPVAVLYRRDLVQRIGGFRADLPVIQDARFLFDAARCGGRFALSGHVAGLYRMQPESLSRRNPVRFWEDIFYNGKQIEALWRSDGPLPPERRDALASIYRHVAQGLLAAGDDQALTAFEACKEFGKPPLRLALMLRLARSIGMNRAPELLGRLSR
jgi:glycosyltransferase involved in cell wall biosynthesis